MSNQKEQGKPGYAGRIGHGGSQLVKAPFPQKEREGDSKTTGKDLRTGK